MPTTWFLDQEGGNDSNNGQSFANRKATYASIVSAGLASGDTVRQIGSPDPINTNLNITLTNQSISATLSAAVTQTLYEDGAWTASTNVTCTTASTRKSGSNSASIAIASGFTTGKAAYYATGTLDLSGYQQLSFRIRTNSNISANVARIRLSTDTTGDTATHEFVLNRPTNGNAWTTFTFNNGAAFNSSIKSIALIFDSDPGTVTYLIDIVLACKAASSADALTLHSLIGKNNGNVDEGWYAIKSINGTTLVIDEDSPSSQGAGRGYSGTTETVALYRRETIKTAAVTFSTTAVQDLSVAGVTISGGWSRTDMASQSLEGSFLDGVDGFGIGFKITANNMTLSKVSAVRYREGFSASGVSNTAIDYAWGIACDNQSLNITGGCVDLRLGLNGRVWSITSDITLDTAKLLQIGSFTSLSAQSAGFNPSNLPMLKMPANGSLIVKNAATQGLNFSDVFNGEFYNVTIRDCGSYAVNASGPAQFAIYGLTTSGNANGVVREAGTNANSIDVVLVNASMSESTKVTFNLAYTDSRVRCQYVGGDTDLTTIYAEGGTIATDSPLEGSEGRSLKFSPTASTRTSTYPLSEKIAEIPVAGGVETTISVKCKRDNTGITLQLRIPGGRVAGVDTDLVETASASAGTVETVTFDPITPDEDSVIEVYADVWGGTTYNAWTQEVAA